MYPRISYTSLTKYEDCHLRLKLHREHKYKQIPTRFVLVGNVLHYVSEQLLLRAIPEQEIVEQALHDFDRRVREADNLGWDAEEQATAKEKIARGAWRLVEIYAELFGGYKREQLIPELHIFKFYEGWSLEGYMDIAVMREDRRIALKVFDVKTGTSHKADQLTFYAVMCEAYFGEAPEELAFIEPLARGIVPVTLTPGDRDSMKDRIKRAVIGMQNDDFGATGFPKKCSWCPSETVCPATAAARAGRIGKVV